MDQILLANAVMRDKSASVCRRKKEACGTDDDAACCMDNVALGDVLPSACLSLRCLTEDLRNAGDAEAAKSALTKHDRHVYLLGGVVAALFVLLLISRLLHPPPVPHPPPWPHRWPAPPPWATPPPCAEHPWLTSGQRPAAAGCTCGRS